MIAVVGEHIADFVRAADGHWVLHPGGSPANVAVGLAHLGVPTLLLARTAGGPIGQTLLTRVRDAGVDVSAVIEAAEPASLAFVSTDAEGRADYAFYVESTADFAWTAGELGPLRDDVVALHAGSLATWLPPGAAAVEAVLAREHARGSVTVSLDPNLRPSLLGPLAEERVRVERQVALADVVRASADDVAWLYPGADPVVIARQWAGLGPSLVVVSLGANGALAVAAGEVVCVPGRRVAVVDTVGAGDSFTAALLAGLHARALLGERRGGPVPDLAMLLSEAVLASSLTCTRAGANPPSATELAAASNG